MNDSLSKHYNNFLFFFVLISFRTRIRRSSVADWTEGLRGAIMNQAKHESLSLAFHRCPYCSQTVRRLEPNVGKNLTWDQWSLMVGISMKHGAWNSGLLSEQILCSAASLAYESQGWGKKKGMGESPGPAEGQIHMELPSTGMNSEWDGCCCWNLSHSSFFCEQDDQWQEGSFTDGPHYK